jgi:hypothetical protein
MRQVAVFVLTVLAIASCRTVEPPTQTCAFKADTLTKGTDGTPVRDDLLDSTRAYTYQYEVVNMDSLLLSLCSEGFVITDAYNVETYLCDDARGPRPVVVLKQTDDRILQHGFWKGSNGRLACAWKIAHYEPTN